MLLIMMYVYLCISFCYAEVNCNGMCVSLATAVPIGGVLLGTVASVLAVVGLKYRKHQKKRQLEESSRHKDGEKKEGEAITPGPQLTNVCALNVYCIFSGYLQLLLAKAVPEEDNRWCVLAI